MKKIVFSGMVMLWSAVTAQTVSAHGLHEGVVAISDHVTIHVIENGTVVIVATLIVLGGYNFFSSVKNNSQTQDRE